MPPSTALSDPPLRHRAGTAARLAGLPVTTLRVWERRYGVAGTLRSGSGQRLYTAHDVARLRLLRHLTQAGHAIGTVATLDLAALQGLAAAASGWEQAPVLRPPEGVVVGRGVAPALELLPAGRGHAVYDDLELAETALPAGAVAGWLLVRLASLQPPCIDRVLALAARLGGAAVLVVYAFGTEASVRALRAAGAAVHRDPVDVAALAEWLGGVQAAPAPPRRPLPGEPGAGGPAIEPRRFSDDALARLAALPSPVACECLRHMTEIVAQLTGFERYSADCGATGPADAELHGRLAHTAGVARTMFEAALQRVLVEAGLEPSADG